MKLARCIEARVFAKDGEDEEAIKAKLLLLFPFNLENEKILLERKSAEGFEHKRIAIYTVMLRKDRHINLFIKRFIERFADDQINLLLDQLDSRIDDELNFFIRLDKDMLLRDDIFLITDSGNCFHVRIGIAAYPANKFAARKTMEKILSGKHEKA